MDVSSIAEQLLFTTVRIETFNPSNNSNLVGTGFFFSYERGDATQKTIVQFIVTNKHVVENGITGRLSFLKGDKENKPKLGERIIFNFDKNFRDLWYFNSDKKIDVAILPLNDLLHFLALKGESVFYRAVSSEMIPKNESLKDIDALEEVIFIGYPYGLWDKKNFLPVFRKGITASPIIHDFEDQKIFLIDASVFPGSSGSPVFIFNQELIIQNLVAFIWEQDCYFSEFYLMSLNGRLKVK